MKPRVVIVRAVSFRCRGMVIRGGDGDGGDGSLHSHMVLQGWASEDDSLEVYIAQGSGELQ